jgi:hypothetical protein
VAQGEEQWRGGLIGTEAAERGRSATVAWRAWTPGMAVSDSNGGTRLRTPSGDATLGHGSGGDAASDTGDGTVRTAAGRLNTCAMHVRTAPLMAANQGAVRSDNATDERAPHVSVSFQFQMTLKSVTRAGKIARQGGKSVKICGGRKSNLKHFS